jgi:D-aminoacyl-tRNA deacylase
MERSLAAAGNIGPMRGLVQRVCEASVTVMPAETGDGTRDETGCRGGELVGSIGPGLCVLVGVTHDDTDADAVKLADKIWHLRVMDDEAGVMNRSVADTTREVLVISQFTLYGDTNGGRRPSWIAAARPEHAEPLVDRVVARLRELGASVATGRFRTEMRVALVNDGPVTVLIEI